MSLDKTATVSYDGGMRQFKYETMDATGAEKSGILGAVDEIEANQKIRQEGYFVTRLQEVFTDHRTFGNIPENVSQETKLYFIGFAIGTILGFIAGFLTGLIF